MDCENCGRTNDPGARYCAGCGVELRQGPGDTDQAESRRSACPNCGTANAPGAAYCAACGVEIGTAATAPTGGGSIPPRGLGALLDESFRVYRANFLHFIAIAAIPQVAFVLRNLFLGSDDGPAQILGFILILVGAVLSIIAVGAMIFGVTRYYVRGDVDVMECLSHAFQVGVLLIAQGIVVTVAIGAAFVVGIVMVVVGAFAQLGGDGAATVGQALLVIGGLLTLAGTVIAAWLGVNWFCAAYAVVIEGKGPIAGLGRSWNLVRGSWWRIFGIGLVFTIVIVVAAMVISIPIGVIGGVAFAAGSGGIVASLAAAAASILITPFAYIAGTLIYFDLRVRKEGFDLDVLADETSRV